MLLHYGAVLLDRLALSHNYEAWEMACVHERILTLSTGRKRPAHCHLC
jgi:hypothetical protein